MDIDTFLDNELGGTKTLPSDEIRGQSSKKKATNVDSDINTESPGTEVPDQMSTSDLSVGAGPFSDKLKKYDQLWSDLSKKEIVWDESNARSIASLGADIQKDFQGVVAQVKTNQQVVTRSLTQVRVLLKQKDYQSAQLVYEHAKKAFDSISDYFVDEKKQLYVDLFNLYHEIKVQLDTKVLAESRKAIDDVHTIVKRGFSYLSHKDIERARQSCIDAISRYSAIANFHIHKKIQLGEFLLSLYREASIHSQIATLQSQLSGSVIIPPKSVHTQQITRADKPNQEKARKMNLAKPQLGSHNHRHLHNSHLIKRLIERKMNRAKLHLEKGFSIEAKKDLEAVLRLDADHKKALDILKKINGEA